MVPKPGDPQSLNRYAYVLNNPLRYNDPSGHRLSACGWDGECPGEEPPVTPMPPFKSLNANVTPTPTGTPTPPTLPRTTLTPKPVPVPTPKVTGTPTPPLSQNMLLEEYGLLNSVDFSIPSHVRIEMGTWKAKGIGRVMSLFDSSPMAVTIGHVVYFPDPKAYQRGEPNARAALLAHELTHVKQMGRERNCGVFEGILSRIPADPASRSRYSRSSTRHLVRARGHIRRARDIQ